ncbi:MAG: DNA mismatch endonuclease Vsr [Candidatus Binatus sp.]|uniref:very short patch repair endonuclease n=1 Tax=Candidatus Binatus sp. TaxID=2811406 RepID=UPI003C722C61
MPDVFTPEKRSNVMARIRAKNTKPELAVRRALHRLGYRFRLHDPRLPGRPDIVLARHRLIIEVNGCFWHGHRCLKGRIPVGNRAYWVQKIGGNKIRERRNAHRLRAMGWKVKTVWECEVRRQNTDQLAAGLRKLFAEI